MESVVKLHEIAEDIIQVTMEDRVNKNMLSDELAFELIQAFESINLNSNYKVVILTGYDSYFCPGGTKDRLLALHEGKEIFTDKSIFRLPLDCKIPVIAAMQGHGIGGGFAMGLFADFIILSRESVYSSNYMKYGFTPGFGATYILPQKLGFSLAEELLLNARNFRGAELEKRGIPFPVLPRVEVMKYSYELARQLAEKPRFSLITLKEHLVAPIKEKLSDAIRRELVMHEKTLHQEEVKGRIMQLFGK